MTRFSLKKLKFSLLIIFLIIVFDQLAKFLVLRSNFNFSCNTGFAFGVFQGVLNGLIAILVLFVVIYIFLTSSYSSSDSEKNKPPYSSSESSLTRRVEKYSLVSSRRSLPSSGAKGSNNNLEMFGWALIIGGGVSNIIDRLIRGCVIDFIDLKVWPAFNLADTAITIGVGILILSLLKPPKNPEVST